MVGPRRRLRRRCGCSELDDVRDRLDLATGRMDTAERVECTAAGSAQSCNGAARTNKRALSQRTRVVMKWMLTNRGVLTISPRFRPSLYSNMVYLALDGDETDLRRQQLLNGRSMLILGSAAQRRRSG